jgi:hypothetical protein
VSIKAGHKGIEEGREELLERRRRSPADFSDQGRRELTGGAGLSAGTREELRVPVWGDGKRAAGRFCSWAESFPRVYFYFYFVFFFFFFSGFPISFTDFVY